jgi:hypothetical protein
LLKEEFFMLSYRALFCPLLALAVVAFVAPAAPAFPPAGPDVTVGDLTGDSGPSFIHPRSYGIVGSIAAYAVGTTSCNVGTDPLQWIDNVASRHPVISQNLFRLKTVSGSTRFEHIGQSWLKHGFCALQQSLCTSCTPYGGCCCDHLGVGCSDPYTASRNGSSSNLGPKFQVNAATGTFIEPHALPGGSATLAGRLQAETADVNPTLNTGALYWVEGMYISNDDAAANNDLNNASYRRVIFLNDAVFTMRWPTAPTEPTVRQEPAINAWKANDPGVQTVNIDIAGDGRMILGYKVTDLSGSGIGPWHYEYGLYNMNSDRSGQSFSVPLASPCITVTNPGFHDVFYHSGEPYVGTDWPPVVTSSSVSWQSETFAVNANANALRFGTLYNYRFDANAAPVDGTITIGLFKTGTPASVTVTASVPSTPSISCLRGDLNNDTLVDSGDVQLFATILVTGGGTTQQKCAGDLEAVPDCAIDMDDVDNFTNCLLAGGPC